MPMLGGLGNVNRPPRRFRRSVIGVCWGLVVPISDMRNYQYDTAEMYWRFKAEVEQKSGRNFGTFDAIEYKTQLVAGTNYFIKTHVGDDQYIHLRVYKKLPCYQEEMSLTAFQVGKTREDHIVHFEPSH